MSADPLLPLQARIINPFADHPRIHKIRETLALCGSEVVESGQLSRCDVCPQGLLDDLDRVEAALF